MEILVWSSQDRDMARGIIPGISGDLNIGVIYIYIYVANKLFMITWMTSGYFRRKDMY